MLSTIRPAGLDDPNNIKPNLFFVKSRFGREDAFLSEVDLLAFEYAKEVDQSKFTPKGRTTTSNSKYGKLAIEDIVKVQAMKEYVRQIYALDIETPKAKNKETRVAVRKARQETLFAEVFPQDVIPEVGAMDTSEGQGSSRQLSEAGRVQEKILAARMTARFKQYVAAEDEVLDKAKFFELRLQDEADLIKEEDEDDGDSDVEADGSASEYEDDVVAPKPKRKKRKSKKIDPTKIPASFFPSVTRSSGSPSQETDLQKLLRVGAVVVDLQSQADLDAMLSQLESFNQGLPFAAKRAINSWEGVPSPMAFHGEEVVRVREVLLDKMRELAKLANEDLFGLNNTSMWAEPLLGALVVHNGAGGGRSMTRSNKQRDNEINLSGFINIGNTYQDFVFVKASYVVGKRIRAISQAEFSKAESISTAVSVARGQAVIYFDTLVHSNHMQTARTFADATNNTRQARLYAGLRLYNADEPKTRLQGDPENMVKKGIVPSHVFGPEYRAYRQINFDDQVQALTANMVPQALDDGKPKLKTAASELMASLAEMDLPRTQVEGRVDLYATRQLIENDGVKAMETTTTTTDAPLFSIIP